MTGHGSLLRIADRSIEQIITFIDNQHPISMPFPDPVAVVVELEFVLPHLEVIVHEGIQKAGALLVHSPLASIWPESVAYPAERVATMGIIAAIQSSPDDEALRRMAATAPVRLLNAGSPDHRPLQILADLLVLKDLLGPLRGRSMVITDGDVGYITSWVQASVRTGIHLTLLPTAIEPTGLARYGEESRLAQLFGSNLTIADDPCQAVRHADIVAGDILLPHSGAPSERIELPLDLSGSHADRGSGGSEGARSLLFHRVERAKDVVSAFVVGAC